VSKKSSGTKADVEDVFYLDYTWEKDNIVKIKEYEKDNELNVIDESYGTYTYDNKKNPFNNAIGVSFDTFELGLMYFSKNNIVSENIYDEFKVEYVYEYAGKYPVKVISTLKERNHVSQLKTIFYEYVD
jgi:hypothetical protein